MNYMERVINVHELLKLFDTELVRVQYSKSRLCNFRTISKRLAHYADNIGAKDYSLQIGQEFLNSNYPAEYGEKPMNSLPCVTQYAIRTITMLNDFYLHRIFTREGRVQRKQAISKEAEELLLDFDKYNRDHGHSEQSVYRFSSDAKKILKYLYNNQIAVDVVTEKDAIDFLGTHVDYSRDTLKKMLFVMRKFLAFLHEKDYLKTDISGCVPSVGSIHNQKIPSVWKSDDVNKLLSAVDRGNALGKRDYAILLLVTKLGLRVSDIKALKLNDINWSDNRVEFFQSKTKKSVSLPLLPDVGWAIIEYLKYGRPKSDIPNVFLTHTAPVMGFSSTSSLSNVIVKYASIGGISLKNHKHGMHSLRHSLAGKLLEARTPLPVISEILGHASPHEVDVYLKVDIENLRQCALNPEEVFTNATVSIS
jgi:site-specific recombinase XerD